MGRYTHGLILVAYVLAAIVAAGLIMRVSAAPPFAAWLFAGLVGVGAAQAHYMLARRTEDRRAAEAIEALRIANIAMLDELEEARSRVTALQTQLVADRDRRDRTLIAELSRLEGAVRAASRRGDRSGSVGGTSREGAQDLSASADDIRDALNGERVDLMMQPIVSLPQRRPQFYEAFTHLRTASGRVMAPAAWLPTAIASDMLADVDMWVLHACARVARSLTAQERRAGIFCNVSAGHFEGAAFPALFDALRGAADVADSLILEMRQTDFAALGVVGMRNLMRTADFGYRFSIDHVENLELDFHALQRVNARFVKIQGRRLVDALRRGGALGVASAPDIVAADYPVLLERHGVQVIVEKVEDEDTVIEALELEVRLGQGRLFGPPRPLREDILAAAASAERARDAAADAAWDADAA